MEFRFLDCARNDKGAGAGMTVARVWVFISEGPLGLGQGLGGG